MKNYGNVKIKHNIHLFFERVFRVLRFDKFRKIASSNKHNIVNSYLENINREIIDFYKISKIESQRIPSDEMKIWFCWLQGEDKMPALIKACYKSIQDNCGKHEVILITSKNLKDYVSIPDYIFEKVEKKQISYAQYSDIIRVNLLKNHGGIWMDSTLYCYSGIPESIFTRKIFSGIKFRESEIPFNTNGLFISNYYWSGFFCGTNEKNNLFFSYMVDCFNQYWKEHDSLLEYLMIDYLFYIAYKNIDFVKKEFDSTPYNNSNAYYLTPSKMNSSFMIENYTTDEENFLFKLSRHYEYIETIDGKDTVYKKIIEGTLNV